VGTVAPRFYFPRKPGSAHWHSVEPLALPRVLPPLACRVDDACMSCVINSSSLALTNPLSYFIVSRPFHIDTHPSSFWPWLSVARTKRHGVYRKRRGTKTKVLTYEGQVILANTETSYLKLISLVLHVEMSAGLDRYRP